jgi:hypothetical protein
MKAPHAPPSALSTTAAPSPLPPPRAAHPPRRRTQSTYCHAIQEHAATKGRTVRVGNLDPAAESFKYNVAFGERACWWRAARGKVDACTSGCPMRALTPLVCSRLFPPHPFLFSSPPPLPRLPLSDIRDLVSVDDVMAEMQLGPNGALLFCMEYLLEDESGWLDEQLQGYMEVSGREMDG